jgi:hypothetical protein
MSNTNTAPVAIRSCCIASDGVTLAEAKHKNVANAIRCAQWYLSHVEGAARGFVPHAQYEVYR